MRRLVVAWASMFVLMAAVQGNAEDAAAKARREAKALVTKELSQAAVRRPTSQAIEREAEGIVRRLSAKQMSALLAGQPLAQVLPTRDKELQQARAALRVATANALGDAESDLVFVPLPPCRVIDTRIAGGALTAGVTRNFEIAGTANFAAQGGTAAGCGVPLGATEPLAPAVFINVVAVDPTGPGHLTGWEFGQSPPNAAILSFAKVGGLNIENGVILPIAGVATLDKDLSIVAGVSNTHVVADVTGYFTRFPTEEFQGALKSTLTTAANTTLVDLSDGGCKELNSCTVTANGNGTVLVEAWSQVVASHTSGTLDRFVMQVETTGSVSCPEDDTVNTSDYELPSTLGTNADVDFTLSFGRTFTQPSGTTRTYRLSGLMANGASSLDKVENSRMLCTFIPD